METVKVKTLDYYNKPGIYPFMPEEVFSILENSFLNDDEHAVIPKHLFDSMVNGIMDNELANRSYRANISMISSN